MKPFKTNYNPDHYYYIRNSRSRPEDFEDTYNDAGVSGILTAAGMVVAVLLLLAVWSR